MGSSRLRAYLSGGMEYARDEGADWRAKMETWIVTELGHSVFNPNVESAQYLRKHLRHGSFRTLKLKNVRRFQSIVRGIVLLDMDEIARSSDYVVCFWDASALRGAGTKGELSIAKYFRKPVYLVTRMEVQRIPGWILGCTTRIFPSFARLKTFLRATYSPRKRPSRDA